MAVPASAAADAPPAGVLVWENGDVLPGTLVGATASELRWKSPAFTGAFTLDVEQLKSVHDPASGAEAQAEEPLRFQTSQGDLIHGRLVDVANGRLAIESRRHGRLQMLQSEVRSFGRLDPRVLDKPDPPSVPGWRSLSTTQTVSQWRADAAGRLTTRIMDAQLGGDFRIGESTEFDLAFTWRRRAAFAVTFGSVRAMRFAGEVVTLEAADDRLLLRRAADDKPQFLQALGEPIHRLRLRVLWDRNAEELSVFSSNGDLLGKAKIASAAGTGLHVKNKGPELTVEYLRMRPSSGFVGRELRDGEAHFRTFDGGSYYGRLLGFDNSAGAIVVQDSQGARRQVAVDNLVSVHFTNHGSDTARPAQVKLRYYDGELLQGTIVSCDGQTLKMQTQFSDAAVLSRMDGARELLFLSGRSATRMEADLLEIGGETGGMLHGALAAAGGERRALGWRPTGSAEASAFSLTHPVRLVRRTPDGDTDSEQLTDVVYLDNGDVVPCRIQALDNEHVSITCDFVRAERVPCANVKAIELNSKTIMPNAGFRDEGWVVTEREKGAVTLSDERIAFSGHATVGHESLLSGEELKFDVQWNPEARCVLTISLYTQDAQRPSGQAMMLYFMEQNLLVRSLNGRGFVQHAPVQAEQPQQGALCRATVKVAHKGKSLEIEIDKTRSFSQPLAQRDNNDRHQGVVFTVQPVAVRRVVNVGGRAVPVEVNEQRPELLTISNLVVSRTGNAVRFLNVDDDEMQSLLTVPRNRKAHPPTHLLVAQNGDLLRGQLLGLTAEHVEFRSRLDTVTFHRDRVAAIVRLKEQQAPPPVDDPQGVQTFQATLTDGTRLTFAARDTQGDAIVGEHAVLGSCRVSLADVRELQMGGPMREELGDLAYANWRLTPAKEPIFPDIAGGDGLMPGFGTDSPLVGQLAEDFAVGLLDGRQFRLAEHTDKVVILDFWATWCGPCAKALPQIVDAVSQFPPEDVLLVAVNQQEPEKAIREYLAAREWEFTVGLDRDGRVGRQFQVEAIPQTVIIGKGGKIARLHIGAHPNLEEELKRVLEELLAEGPGGE